MGLDFGVIDIAGQRWPEDPDSHIFRNMPVFFLIVTLDWAFRSVKAVDVKQIEG